MPRQSRLAPFDAGDAATAAPRRRNARRTVLLALWGLLLTAVFAAAALRSSDESGLDAAAADARIARGRDLVARAKLSDEDRAAVYAYLRTLPSMRERVPDTAAVPPPAAPAR